MAAPCERIAPQVLELTPRVHLVMSACIDTFFTTKPAPFGAAVSAIVSQTGALQGMIENACSAVGS